MKNPYLPQPAKILNIKKQTAIDYTFTLEYDTAAAGGQFLEVSIPGYGECPISISDFDDKTVDLTIRKLGRLTSEIFNKKEGESLFLRGPYGNGFSHDEFKGKHLIIAAGGTGLAPVKSVINYFASSPESVQSFTLLLGFKSREDILFIDEINKWKEKVPVTLTVDKGDENWTGKTGLITEFISSLGINKDKDYAVIVVGPPLMMKFTTLEFLKNGISEEELWVSFERKMSCGIGKCGHCKIDNTYVCLEGPVFPYIEAKKLID